jgi:hypothetical protein
MFLIALRKVNGLRVFSRMAKDVNVAAVEDEISYGVIKARTDARYASEKQVLLCAEDDN